MDKNYISLANFANETTERTITNKFTNVNVQNISKLSGKELEFFKEIPLDIYGNNILKKDISTVVELSKLEIESFIKNDLMNEIQKEIDNNQKVYVIKYKISDCYINLCAIGYSEPLVRLTIYYCCDFLN